MGILGREGRSIFQRRGPVLRGVGRSTLDVLPLTGKPPPQPGTPTTHPFPRTDSPSGWVGHRDNNGDPNPPRLANERNRTPMASQGKRPSGGVPSGPLFPKGLDRGSVLCVFPHLRFSALPRPLPSLLPLGPRRVLTLRDDPSVTSSACYLPSENRGAYLRRFLSNGRPAPLATTPSSAVGSLPSASPFPSVPPSLPFRGRGRWGRAGTGSGSNKHR